MARGSALRYLPDDLAEQLRSCQIVLPRPMVGLRQGQHRSRQHGASVEFADYRPYSPGDPPNLIDWQVYARSDRYLIRRHEEETSLSAWLLIDRSESLAWRGAGPMPKGTFACSLAAAIAYVLVQQGDSVGMAHFTDRITGRIAPTSSYAGLRAMLKNMEQWVFTGASGIAACMHTFADEDHRRSLVYVLSDFLDDAGAVQEAVHHLLHAGHEVRLLHIMDRAEVNLPWEGLVDCRAMEKGGRLLIEVDAVREAYRHEVERHIAALRAAATGSRAAYRLCRSDESPLSIIRDRAVGGRS